MLALGKDQQSKPKPQQTIHFKKAGNRAFGFGFKRLALVGPDQSLARQMRGTNHPNEKV